MAKQPKFTLIIRPTLSPSATADPHNVYPVLDAVLKKHRQNLLDLVCRIGMAWMNGNKADKDGHLCLGKCVKVPDLHKLSSEYDFIILLNKEHWIAIEKEKDARTALVHHEVCHIGVVRLKNGEVKVDAYGNNCFRKVKHDIEEFQEVANAYGCYKSDIEDFVKGVIDSKKPPSLPGMGDEPVKPSPKLATGTAARNRKAKKKGEGAGSSADSPTQAEPVAGEVGTTEGGAEPSPPLADAAGM